MSPAPMSQTDATAARAVGGRSAWIRPEPATRPDLARAAATPLGGAAPMAAVFPEAPVDPAPRLTAVSTGVDGLLACAAHEVLVLSDQATAAGPFGPVRRIDHWNLRRGVRYRVVAPDSAPGLDPRLGALVAAGADTRTVPEVPAVALVVDGSVVVVPAEGGAGAAVVRLPGVVTALTALFERVWAGAAPLPGPPLSGPAKPGARERELLTMLTDGCTDEVAAVRLGVSVRTVRRMVSDLMRRLGARSRFQAGAKAAERGWLPGD
ncbi:regulatory LuxR family protein [Actinokineospora spheciospongiae]|nr:regulatory LuxR family protein [Actinokineospora spheciospongiae]